MEHGSEDFIQEHSSSLGKEETSADQELVQLFQDMYLWEAFKHVAYEEPMPRKPRYSLENTMPKKLIYKKK